MISKCIFFDESVKHSMASNYQWAMTVRKAGERWGQHMEEPQVNLRKSLILTTIIVVYPSATVVVCHGCLSIPGKTRRNHQHNAAVVVEELFGKTISKMTESYRR